MSDTPEYDKLMHRLFGDPNRKTGNFSVTWGDQAHLLTREERCKAINDAMDAVARGDYEELPPEEFDRSDNEP